MGQGPGGIGNGPGVVNNRHGEPQAYGRGSAARALESLNDPSHCRALLLSESRASTAVGPAESRLKLWETMSVRASLEPFHLTPDGMYVIMGAMKEAGYRSAMQYLDLAKQEHIQRGHPWTAQHVLAYKVCARSCRRGLGPTKQASALPLDKLATLDQASCSVSLGPVPAVTSTIVASWWLLREIEASRARVRHVTLDFGTKTAAWLLPSSKTDVVALGAVRKHSCSCTVLPPALCPFHALASLIHGKSPEDPVFCDAEGRPPSKSGWADTFQGIAAALGLPLVLQNGARAYTGHSARATGAQFLATRGIELWRIQIFGRWGSDIILRYLREAPLAHLSELAVESGHGESIARIRGELEALLAKANPILAIPDEAWREEGPLRARPAPLPEQCRKHLILNTARGGKLHKCLTDLSTPGNALNPRCWRTCCLWLFASGEAKFSWVPGNHRGRKCKHCFPGVRRAPSGSSESSSGSSSSTGSSSSSSDSS